MDDTTILGSALGQVGQTVKQAAKQVVKMPEEVAADVGGQVGGVKPQEKPAETAKPQWQSDEERVKFLKGLYGKSDVPQQDGLKPDKNGNSNPPVDKKPSEFQEKIADKPPEEQKKLLELRNQLHKENYYDPTFNPPKKQDEERPAEKVEKEKKMEMQDIQQKEAKKPPPLAVVREQNKAEMFRGASG